MEGEQGHITNCSTAPLNQEYVCTLKNAYCPELYLFINHYNINFFKLVISVEYKPKEQTSECHNLTMCKKYVLVISKYSLHTISEEFHIIIFLI